MRELQPARPSRYILRDHAEIPVPVAAILHAPLRRQQRTIATAFAAVGDVVGVRVGKRAIPNLSEVDDAIAIAVGGPFDDVGLVAIDPCIDWRVVPLPIQYMPTKSAG